jgi:hypothetical protein
MIAMVFVAFVMARIFSDDVRYRIDDHGTTHVGNPTGPSIWSMHGTRTNRFSGGPPELAYAILACGTDSPPTVMGDWSRGLRTYRVISSDGTSIELPAENLLFDVIDSRIVPREGSVTLKEFKDFVSQPRPDWSVNGLLEHARQMREASKK